MGKTNRRASAWPSLAVLLAVLLSAMQPAIAADSLASEREQLAALTRQFDLIDRLAEHAANTAPQERARYHFDYAPGVRHFTPIFAPFRKVPSAPVRVSRP